MKTKKSTMIIVGSVFSVIGIILITVGVFLVSNYIEKKKTFVDTQGVVIDYDIKGGYDEDPYDDYYDEDLLYAPIVMYIVDGKEYEAIHDVYSSYPEYIIGQKVSLKYNPKDPNEVIFKFNNSFWIAFLAGALFAGCGVTMLFAGIFKKNKV